MGCIRTIDFDNFPKQTNKLGKIVRVCFHYNTSRIRMGRVIRDDSDEPFRTIIQLDNGRIVDSTECQWSFAEDELSQNDKLAETINKEHD